MSDLMFENFVIIEILKSYRNRGVEPLLSYFRSRGSKEISLLIEDKGKLHLNSRANGVLTGANA